MPKATKSRMIVILLIIIRSKVAGLHATARFPIVIVDLLLKPEKVTPKSINTATESGSNTPSAKKLNPRKPVT
jgi:hypothetical protein